MLNFGLFYAYGVDIKVFGYSDADWAGLSYDRRSSFGSGTVSWSSKKQPTIALSSTEAEYCGAAVAACEVAWLRKLLADLCVEVPHKIVIYCDNLSNLQLT